VEQQTTGPAAPLSRRHTLSVVIPVYQGERTLPGVLAEIDPFTADFTTPAGHRAVITEVLLVHDNGPDGSAAVIRDLERSHPYVRPVWLSRNFGQHPATLAGMASSGGDWIVTVDEDGQHDPAQIGRMLDTAIGERAQVVYARPTNAPPHGFVRNVASRTAKRIVSGSDGTAAADFNSFRLVLGEIGRSVAAYAGSGVYLDVAIGWVANGVTTCPVALRDEGSERRSGYSYRRLLSHFWRMVLSSGTKGLRLVSVLGVVAAVLGVVLAAYLLIATLVADQDIPAGWPSLMSMLLVATGAILFSLGIIAEYIGVAVNMAMGRPLYLIVSDPADGPLGAGSAQSAAPRVDARADTAPAAAGTAPAAVAPRPRATR
jgi:glycosyltransferase involved in cell wall biosynthesis